jgi:hypothetical protein
MKVEDPATVLSCLFKLLWPLVWQKRFLMPLVERRGIYCFYSNEFVLRLTRLIDGRTCHEIAAGDGTLSRFLTHCGVPVTASDDHSWADRISSAGSGGASATTGIGPASAALSASITRPSQ